MPRLNPIVCRLNRLEILRRINLQRAINDIELYKGQLPLLEYVIEYGGCTQNQIAEALHVTPASVALSTKRMQMAGLLEKNVDETNLRCKRLTVTDKGRDIAVRCRAAFNKLDGRMLRDFSPEETDLFKSLLDKAIANIDTDREEFYRFRQRMFELDNKL